jgi:hypothetical protein
MQEQCQGLAYLFGRIGPGGEPRAGPASMSGELDAGHGISR